MSLFIRLSIVVAIAVLLRCVPATVVITAPSTVTDSTAVKGSFFSDHVREVRYDYATTGQGKNAEPLTEKSMRHPLSRPTVVDYGTLTLLIAKEYLHTTVLGSRLNLSDVLTRVVSGPNGQSHGGCAWEAYSSGLNAFSFVSGACKVYQLEKNFSPCAPGDFDIYINPKPLGWSTAFPTEKFAKGVAKLVIYTEVPLDTRVLSSKPAEPVKDRSQCAAILGGYSTYSVAYLFNGMCYIGTHQDFNNCNQTCRGQPVDILVKRQDPIPERPILSLCGQKIVVPMIDNGRYIRTYFSHAGFGCYRYQGAKNAGEEDCIVTFEKDIKTVALNIEVAAIGLNSEGKTCLDVLSIYKDNTTTDALRKFNGCSPLIFEHISFTAQSAITIKFHRGLGSEKNFGFKLIIRNYYF